MNIIFSFSLYGDNRKYSDPLFINMNVIKSNFNNFEIYIYYDSSVPSLIINELKKKGANVFEMTTKYNTATEKMSWRYGPIFNNLTDCCIIRDSDSVISIREIGLIKEWLNSSYNFHIIRDHPLHNMPIMGGLFAIKKPIFDRFQKQFRSKFKKYISLEYNGDQLFLAHEIYPLVVDDSFIQTSCFSFMFEKVLRIKKAKNPANYIGSVYLGDQKYNSHLSFMYERSKEEIGLPYLLYKIINFRAINFFSKIITKLR
jgi:hypothetical protein